LKLRVPVDDRASDLTLRQGLPSIVVMMATLLGGTTSAGLSATFSWLCSSSSALTKTARVLRR